MRDYERSDAFAGKCATAAIESEAAPFTVEGVCLALGSPMPISADDLRALAVTCKRWGIRTVLDGDMTSWDEYQDGVA